jgi:hypothetical protein
MWSCRTPESEWKVISVLPNEWLVQGKPTAPRKSLVLTSSMWYAMDILKEVQRQCNGVKIIRNIRARRLPKDSDFVLVAAESTDVVLNPLECRFLIIQAKIQCSVGRGFLTTPMIRYNLLNKLERLNEGELTGIPKQKVGN